MNIVIIGRHGGSTGASSSSIRTRLLAFIDVATKKGHTVISDNDTVTSFELGYRLVGGSLKDTLGELHYSVDACVVFGGDGTMLHVSKLIAQYARKQIPVLGVNHGRVGFITDMSSECTSKQILEVLTKTGRGEARTLLMSYISDSHMRGLGLALNDVLISRSNGKILQFEVWIDDHLAYTSRADGIMVATPTGSTAYAMSAGGPIIHPTADVFEILPMVPQTMSYRPLLVKDSSFTDVKLLKGEASIYIDGVDCGPFKPGQKLHIQKAQQSAIFLHPPTYDYYDTLRTKLNWHLEPGRT